MTVGQRIRSAIEAKRLKDIWVADGAGTTLSNIINGITQDPRSSMLPAIGEER